MPLQKYWPTEENKLQMVKELIPRIQKVDATSQHIVNLTEVKTDFELLIYVKKYIEFFLRHDIIDREWLKQFPKDILNFLNIYVKGANNLALSYTALNAVVIDCHLTADCLDDTCTIKVFGKGYLEARLLKTSVTSIKLFNKSKAEVDALDNSVARITLKDKADLRINKHHNTTIKIENLTKKLYDGRIS